METEKSVLKYHFRSIRQNKSFKKLTKGGIPNVFKLVRPLVDCPLLKGNQAATPKIERPN